MRRDKLLKRYEIIYEEVGKRYNSGRESLEEACRGAGVSSMTYRNACRALGKPNVAACTSDNKPIHAKIPTVSTQEQQPTVVTPEH